jgi:bifunctional N-acetylglucosamine-1-phosphate-uridyltransferase/glucosamine-1-phosphate-acetyltransferase GlmU-like protein
MKQKRGMCSIILAAGKGTRIGLTKTHKTCLPVGGRPIIVRSIEAYRAAGVSSCVVIVGTGAPHVLKTVGSAFSDTIFAYQPQPLGTGNAAKCGASALASVGYDGDVLIVAGDKLVEEKVIKTMIRKFRSSGLDCLFLVGSRESSPGSGRVIFDNQDRPVRIIEAADIRRARVLSQILRKAEEGQAFPDFVARAIAAEGLHQQKVRSAFGRLYDFASGAIRLSSEELKELVPSQNTYFTVPFGKRTRKLSAEEADVAEYVNLSVYLLTSEALDFAVKKIKADNAQNEEYLTDIIEVLARARKEGRRRFTLGTMEVDDPRHVMGFNNLEELRAIEEYVREKESWA